VLTPQPLINLGGKQLYRMSDGRVVELPPDMTIEEAARLEAEAKAAEKKLGKGPPPKPVPDVKQLDKKEVKKSKPELGAKGKGARAQGKAARKPAAAPTTLKIAGTRKVAIYLAAKGAPVLGRGVSRLQRMRQNEQTHDEAAQKLTQSEKAVVNPPAEGQSKSNAGQVTNVGDRPAPVVDANKARQKLQTSLGENVPRSIEDVDNFKRDKKAQHMGADVMTVVQGDKNAVTSTFAEMEKTPPPAPPEQLPEALPPEEIAPSTATMNLGQGAIAPLQKEHTDLSNYTKEADGKLKEEGVTQEQLDMVDSGDLAVANKEKKGMETTAKTEPLAVQKFATQETAKVDQDLRQQEKSGRDGLKAKRKASLGTTAQKQKGTKSALEKKREEVANKINGIYQTAQDKVKKKLADLETQSMKRFDDGNAKATKEFEDTVNRELDAFKDDRYSGFFGWARKAKDWLLGMDDLPEVKAIFDRNRALFVSTINKLVDDISADNQRVIQDCKDELARAKKEIKDYVDKLGPDLKSIGKQAAEEMNGKLNELDRFVAKKEQELQDNLKDKQQAAIKAIDEKIEKMKEAMSGALAKLGKLLLWAAKKFFTWALEKFGFSLSEIESIINKGVAVLKAIFTKPIQFVKNLVKAASEGFKNFGKNFLTHLKDAIFDWLTGSLEGVTLPSTWDLKGIASVALQILGLTWPNIRAVLVDVIGEKPVQVMETSFDLVVALIRGGPMAAWEKLQEMANDIQEAFLAGVKEFVKSKIIQKAIETIISLFVPGAGIIRAIIGIYDTIVFFIQKAKDILKMIGSFLSSIAEIAAGNIGAAAGALENGLARALALVINFLARFLRLDGITAKIRNSIQKLRDKVKSMLVKVAHWIVGKAQALGRFITGKGGSARQQQQVEYRFTMAEESHTLRAEVTGRGVRLTMASTTFKDLDDRLREMSNVVKYFSDTGEPKIATAVDKRLEAIRQKHTTGQQQIAAAPEDRKAELTKTLLSEIGSLFSSLDKYLSTRTPLGEAVTVRRGNYVLLNDASGAVTSGGEVSETMVRHEERPPGAINAYVRRVIALLVKVKVGSQTHGRSYSNYGAGKPNGWVLTTRPKSAGVTPLNPGGEAIVDQDAARFGSDASGDTTSAYAQSIGFDPVRYKIRGHVVARVFGGKGGLRSGNIVPMTEDANSLGSRSMWKGVEQHVLRDVTINTAVYRYKAVPIYGQGMKPPIEIHVTTKREWPTAKKPSYVPADEPYVVKND